MKIKKKTIWVFRGFKTYYPTNNQTRITQLTIKDAIPENKLTEKGKTEINKFIEIEKTVDRENLVYKTNK